MWGKGGVDKIAFFCASRRQFRSFFFVCKSSRGIVATVQGSGGVQEGALGRGRGPWRGAFKKERSVRYKSCTHTNVKTPTKLAQKQHYRKKKRKTPNKCQNTFGQFGPEHQNTSNGRYLHLEISRCTRNRDVTNVFRAAIVGATILFNGHW